MVRLRAASPWWSLRSRASLPALWVSLGLWLVAAAADVVLVAGGVKDSWLSLALVVLLMGWTGAEIIAKLRRGARARTSGDEPAAVEQRDGSRR